MTSITSGLKQPTNVSKRRYLAPPGAKSSTDSSESSGLITPSRRKAGIKMESKGATDTAGRPAIRKRVYHVKSEGMEGVLKDSCVRVNKVVRK